MRDFVLTGGDVFGRYCLIEQFRYHSPNEKFLYKVVASLRTNSWCEVPYKTASHEVNHDHMEDCILAICCGIDEAKVQRFRAADVELLPERAERTCRKVPGRMKYGRRMPKCSECGQSLGDDRWGYCPRCGARVVSDDA